MLWKTYFDTGFGILNYLKYPLVLLGFAVPDVKSIIIVAVVYAISCFFLGWAFYRWDWISYQIEIQNHFNPFAQEVRQKMRLCTKVT